MPPLSVQPSHSGYSMLDVIEVTLLACTALEVSVCVCMRGLRVLSTKMVAELLYITAHITGKIKG